MSFFNSTKENICLEKRNAEDKCNKNMPSFRYRYSGVNGCDC